MIVSKMPSGQLQYDIENGQCRIASMTLTDDLTTKLVIAGPAHRATVLVHNSVAETQSDEPSTITIAGSRVREIRDIFDARRFYSTLTIACRSLTLESANGDVVIIRTDDTMGGDEHEQV